MIRWKKRSVVAGMLVASITAASVLAGDRISTAILPSIRNTDVPSDKIKAKVGSQKADQGGKPEHAEGKWMVYKDGMRYQYLDGNHLYNTWANINGNSYYFDGSGKRVSGWVPYKGEQYYFDSEGILKKGWITVDGSTYYLNQDGAMVTSDWIKEKKKRYYINENGEVVTGWNVIGNKKYYMDENGVMLKGWVDADGFRYYLLDDGGMHTGWAEIDGYRYFFDNDGVLQTGWLVQDGAVHYLDSEGRENDSAKYSINSGKTIALTFDDGPGAYTDRIVNALSENGVCATFFMLGQNVENNPETVAHIAQAGNEIGNFTYDGSYLSNLTAKEIKNQFNKTNKAIKAITGSNPTVARTPHGEYNDVILKRSGLPMVRSTLDTEDWRTVYAPSTVVSVLSRIENGDIVLMHDTYEATAEAMEILLPELKAEGVRVVTVSELIGGPKAGEVY